MTSAKLWIGLFIAACIAFSCSKDKYGSTPYIALKSVNPTVVDTLPNLLTFTLELTEKKYNAGDTMFIWMTVLNCPGDNDTLALQMTSLASGIPETNVGNGFKGDVQITFGNNADLISEGYPDIEPNFSCHVGPNAEDDTAMFKFVLGSSGHYSDTVTAGPIVFRHAI